MSEATAEDEFVQRRPDYYMCSLEDAGAWAKVRECFIEYRVRGPRHTQYAVVRIVPPVFLPVSGSTLATVLITPRENDATLFPQSGSPLPVSVYLPTNPGAGFNRHQVRVYDVFLEAECALFPDRRSAELALGDQLGLGGLEELA